MKICIFSDSHDRTELMTHAAKESIGHGVEAFLHCGDLIESETLDALGALGKPIHLVHGNNRGDLFKLRTLAARTENAIRYYGEEADFELGNRRVFLSHYPERAHYLATSGQWDLLCCGHSHTTEIRRVVHQTGESVVLNPGTIAGIGAPATYAVGDLATLTFEIRTLSLGDTAAD